jgi:hypothetical protein
MTLAAAIPSPVIAKVERMREALLDLSNRNQLLNFKHSERSRMHIRVIDELPEFLFERLVGGRELRFKAFERPTPKADPNAGGPDPSGKPAALTSAPGKAPVTAPSLAEPRWQDVAAALGIDTSFELPRPSTTPAAHHTDNAIQVPHFTDVAERKMECIRQTYRTLLEEMGVPALFGAFGFLEWYETAAEKDPQFAPLVLLPLELERTKAGYRYEYRVRANDEDPQANLSLQLRLNRLGIELPSIDQDDAQISLSTYLERVEARIKHMPRWRVRRFVTFGIFHFARQVMYQDLEPTRWTAGAGIDRHPLLAPILGLAAPDARFKGSPVPTESFVQHLVTDSDASQREAIAQALGGGSMVIKGPPGTGKSQTITNLITAALGAGKTVLFIAEKMAALEVVKKRLDDAGLGSYCVELHSTKTKKKEFIDELDRALNARSEVRRPDDGRQIAEGMARIEKEIGSYDRAMSTPIGLLGEPLKDLVWSAERLRASIGQLPARLGDVTISGAEGLTREQLDDDRAALVHLERAWWAVADSAGKTHRHPWRFVDRGSLSIADQDRLLGATRDWLRALEEIENAMRELPGASLQLTRADLRGICAALVRLPSLGAASPGVLRRLESDGDQEPLKRLVVGLRDLQTAQAALSDLTTNLEATMAVAQSAVDLHVEVQRWSAEAATLQQVQAMLPGWRKQVAAIRDSGRLAADLLRRCEPQGTPRVSSTPAVRAILAMAACLRDQKKRVLLLRSEFTLDDALVGTFREMAEHAVRLKGDRDNLDRKYSGWRQKSAAELRTLAFVLRTTPFFGRMFGAGYRAAKLEFLRLTTGRKAPRLEMADQLEALANFAETWERWPASAPIPTLAGPAYLGMDTDFDGLSACSQWAQSCRQSLAVLGTDTRWVLDTLYRGSQETLEVIETSLTPAHVERLEQWASQSRSGDVETWATRKTQQLDRMEAAAAALLRAGVRATAVVAHLPTLHQLSTDLARLRDNVHNNKRGIEIAGPEWAGVETVLAPLDAAVTVRSRIAALALPTDVERNIFEDPAASLGRLQTMGVKIAALLAREDRARSAAESLGAANARVLSEQANIGHALGVLRAAVSTPEHLAEWVAFRRAWDEAIRSSGPRDFLNGLDWSEIPPEQLSMVFELAVYRSLCSVAQDRFPGLSRGTWSGAHLSAAVAKHAALDVEALGLQRDALRFGLAKKEIPEGRGAGPRSTDRALIRHEASKKKRHQSIRQLMKNALPAIQGLKPCFMMSPLSVAQYLEAGRVSFDMVVIDEASQMRPAESLGALLRTQQIVVVGDRQQLPPTAFFDSLERADDERSEDEVGSETGNTESILDLMATTQPPTCDLRWHYRSRHESLIQFSNAQFYDGRLNVLPSPTPGRKDLGVDGRHVAGLYSESTNPIEANAVVEAALDFMRSSPARSLGIVAMNQKQAELIRTLVDEKLRTADLGYEEKWKGTLEPFFVKNLENVQGDERDVIFVSLTYGPSAHGQRPAQRFGPINGAFGHRRLNVLFTRAKYQLVLFSSMRPEQVEVRDTSQRGVRVLHEYLAFAFGRSARGATATRPASGKRRRSTEHLTEELTRHGLTVESDIGAQNIELPIAVLHPDTPGSYACAVECDGNFDQTTQAADFRERTRVFPQMLDTFGWRRVGTWTADWLRNPLTAQQELVRGVEASVARPLSRRADAVPTERPQPIPWVILEADQSLAVGLPSPTLPRPNADDGYKADYASADLTSGEIEPELVKSLRSASYFASVRTGDTWERLVMPLVTLLTAEGGSAPLPSVARALGFPAYRIQGVLAEVQERLNAGQHPVLSCDREAGQVRLDVALLEQLVSGSV